MIVIYSISFEFVIKQLHLVSFDLIGLLSLFHSIGTAQGRQNDAAPAPTTFTWLL
jgi:hypothetical protein